MFKKKQNTMAKSIINESKPNTIVEGTVIKGEITANGDFRIDGKLVGSINSKGKIVVGTNGSIEGEITCKNADFSGTIKAKVFVEQLLSLKASSKLNGDVVTGKLAIEPGATFTGTCSMDSTAPGKITSQPDNGQNKEKQKLFK
jgi:cytoskeletal protein CcmA (bactofilin family)